jgi:hypothetical protein
MESSHKIIALQNYSPNKILGKYKRLRIQKLRFIRRKKTIPILCTKEPLKALDALNHAKSTLTTWKVGFP